MSRKNPIWLSGRTVTTTRLSYNQATSILLMESSCKSSRTMVKPNLSMVKPNLSMVKPNLSMVKPSPSTVKPNLSTNQPSPSMVNPLFTRKDRHQTPSFDKPF